MKTHTQSTHTPAAYNATAQGQKDMAYNADNVGLCLTLARKIRSLGGVTWDDAFIQSANPSTLLSIRDDMISDYNSLVTKPSQSANNLVTT